MSWLQLLAGATGAGGQRQDLSGQGSMQYPNMMQSQQGLPNQDMMAVLQGGGGGQMQQPQQQQQPASDGPGQEAANNSQQVLQGVQNAMEFGTQGVPPSLQNQLGQAMTQEQMVANTPEPQFGQYFMPGTYDGGVLPPREQGPEVPMFNPQMMQQQVSQQAAPPMGGMPQMGMAPQAQQGQQQQPQPGFGGLMNMTGTAEQPNLFLRLAEGYNRGGLMGSIGTALTRY